ncbi:MAG: acetyl-CoA carboxylase, biotin carboxyl carrier protein, partial [Marinovum sp.]|nr:acetyl-CoA carboxylase, biotin carboxyl carrier protein [Marinovum sp.]
MTKKNNDDDVIFIQALATVLRDNDLTELQVERQDGDDRSLNIHLSRAVHVPPAA